MFACLLNGRYSDQNVVIVSDVAVFAAFLWQNVITAIDAQLDMVLLAVALILFHRSMTSCLLFTLCTVHVLVLVVYAAAACMSSVMLREVTAISLSDWHHIYSVLSSCHRPVSGPYTILQWVLLFWYHKLRKIMNKRPDLHSDI